MEWLFAKLQPGRARKRINATLEAPFSRALYVREEVLAAQLRQEKSESHTVTHRVCHTHLSTLFS